MRYIIRDMKVWK